jgi:hypothetical protein
MFFPDILSQNIREGAVRAQVRRSLPSHPSGALPWESLQTETHSCWSASVTSDSDMTRQTRSGSISALSGWGAVRMGQGKWAAASPDLSLGGGAIQAIAVAPSDPDTILHGSSDGYVSGIRDALATAAIWTNIAIGPPFGNAHLP